MDSGATSHCSPYHKDFAKLTPIKPRGIHSVDSASISAIGIGKIKLHLGKSWQLTLCDTLFAPQATLHLISVGHLANDGLACMFEKEGCTICNTTGKTLAAGT